MIKVTEEQVEKAIVETERQTIVQCGKRITLVSVRLSNGFVLTETSTCIDDDNYDAEIGFEICMKRIKDKVWMLEGYALADRLFRGE